MLIIIFIPWRRQCGCLWGGAIQKHNLLSLWNAFVNQCETAYTRWPRDIRSAGIKLRLSDACEYWSKHSHYAAESESCLWGILCSQFLAVFYADALALLPHHWCGLVALWVQLFLKIHMDARRWLLQWTQSLYFRHYVPITPIHTIIKNVPIMCICIIRTWHNHI